MIAGASSRAGAEASAEVKAQPGVPQAPPPGSVMSKAPDENFPVASRLLPRAARGHLLALYGFARLVDDVGDETHGDRLALLDELEADLEQVWGGSPSNPLIARLQPTVSACALPIEPFRRLVEANRCDQVKHRYETYDELLAYCALSANPVGELVLRVFGAATPLRLRLSDAVCSGLQLLEHWQDVAEDYRRGRVYIPVEDRESFGVSEAELGAATPTPSFRRLMAFEVERARALLRDGEPLIGTMRGRLAFAIAAFIAGGQSALGAIEAAGYDVLGDSPRPSRRARATTLIGLLLRSRTRS